LPGFAGFFCLVTKETGERKRRRSIAARLFSLRFSHRYQRIAKAQLIWYSASPNGLSAIDINNYMLYKTADPHPVRHDGCSPTVLVSDFVGRLGVFSIIRFIL